MLADRVSKTQPGREMDMLLATGEQETIALTAMALHAIGIPAVSYTGAQAGSAGGSVVRLWQVADIVDGPQEVESLALYNGQRTVLLSVQKSQGENTIDVVDGLNKALAGSANLDSRSLFLNYELMVAFHQGADVRRFIGHLHM